MERRAFSREGAVEYSIRSGYNPSREAGIETGHFSIIFPGHWLPFGSNWLLGEAKFHTIWDQRLLRDRVFLSVTQDNEPFPQSD